MTATVDTTTTTPTTHHGTRWIDDWRPEDVGFWENGGKQVARRNLVFSILSEHIGFSVWTMWSVLVLFLGPKYGFAPEDKFLLTSVPALVGSVLRLPYTFAVAKFGGRTWTVFSALLLLVPLAGMLAVLKPGVSLNTLLLVAALAGVGGGNFASSMANINTFYPDRLKGRALGLNAGGGNLGVAAVQLVGAARAGHGRQDPPADARRGVRPAGPARSGSRAGKDGQPDRGAERQACDAGRHEEPAHLGDVVPLHRHLRVVHRFRLRLRAGADRCSSRPTTRRPSTRPT